MTETPRATRAVCNHCGVRYPQRKTIPLVDDDAAWNEIARHHKPNCVWVKTRAGRLPEPQSGRGRK